MLRKHSLMLALLVPLAMVSACKRNDADLATPPAADTATAPASTATPAPPATMPADTTSAPADNMAPDAMPGAQTSFADLDKNHDGSLTKDELLDGEMLKDHFSMADTNSDGKLSEAEAAKHRADMAAAPAKP